MTFLVPSFLSSLRLDIRPFPYVSKIHDFIRTSSSVLNMTPVSSHCSFRPPSESILQSFLQNTFHNISNESSNTSNVAKSMPTPPNRQHQTLILWMTIDKKIPIRRIRTPTCSRKAKGPFRKLRHRISQEFPYTNFSFFRNLMFRVGHTGFSSRW
jgi:hypothetical protein